MYPAPNFVEIGVDIFVTDRFNGVSAGPYESLNLGDHVGDDEDHVSENRARVARAAGVEPDRFITVRQVHGEPCSTPRTRHRASEADALFTEISSTRARHIVADCVPLVFADTSSGRVALVHAGWRGLQAGVIASTVNVRTAANARVCRSVDLQGGIPSGPRGRATLHGRGGCPVRRRG